MSHAKFHAKAGLPPGTPVYVDKIKAEKVDIHVIEYGTNGVKEFHPAYIKDIFPLKEEPSVTWINVTGLHDVQLIQDLCNHFSIHPLVTEDIVHLGQRPKMEEFDAYLFLVLRMFYFKKNEIVNEQVSIILGPNYVITFQEVSGDVFDPVRKRIRSGKFRINEQKADYLAYSLMDVIVDNYFVILEQLGEKVEYVEDALLRNPNQSTLHKIHILKRSMLSLRRSVWPLREVINSLDRTESKLMLQTTRIYLRDLYDHTIQVIDTIENYRDILSGMIDTYLSSVSNRMNEVMKILTIIATIFIPLTFISGVYGMNFKYMPELSWRWGYPAVLLLMIAIAMVMLAFFRKKKWL